MDRQEKMLQLLDLQEHQVYRSLSANLHEQLRQEGRLTPTDFSAVALEHGPQLDWLAQQACGEGGPEDLIVVLDSDVILLPPVTEALSTFLSSSDLLVVHRTENNGDDFPHPLFFATTLSTYRHHRLLWNVRADWTNSSGTSTRDVGTGLGHQIRDLGLSCRVMTKSNRDLFSPNPILFSTYGDSVYHHGAGSRQETRFPWGSRAMIVKARRWAPLRNSQLKLAASVSAAILESGEWVVAKRIAYVKNRSASRSEKLAGKLDFFLNRGDLTGWGKFVSK